ncbi:hypothetical protein CSIM01_13613 [Colletotrichum simmondsii]|uniref:Velvet domain-containing protein n=1 Tax=Colletotrichum simmondsii TaxID=703756 RepID=A0A135SJI7_9PEZI|nr:hypothetical protein CSIM01_13613 [Colletotrichum simmondsii]
MPVDISRHVQLDHIGESESYEDRPTRSGSRMWYELKVLQQPERARACGSGQKSAADRRPVDPPPVVQLHVYEGPTRAEATDITFNYRANFFLYAELTPARPMAHGRVQTPAATSPPVLTGMPVSGMAYLDRPTEAGYFLFPDLSVRHEGRYVLAFHLYEDVKRAEDREPGGDADDEDENPCFQYRMAVKSVPFNVFSAKKFPGLTESTNLSKTISEQGCRVRIRRDVRMRRRDGKPTGNEFDTNPENEFRSTARRTQTPEIRSNAEQYRARSTSNSSEHRAAYPPAPERKPSLIENFKAETFQAPPPPPPPMSYGPAPSTNVHLRFGSDASSAPYPPHQYAQPSAQPPPISPTTASYQSQQPSPYQPASYGYSSRPSSQYASSNPPPTPRDSYDRRPSAMMVPPSPSVYGPGPRDHDMARRDSDYRRDSLPPRQLAPVSDLPHMGTKLPPMLPSIEKLTAPPMAGRSEFIEAAPPSSHNPVYESARAGTKRGYGDTFIDSQRPLYDRQRPQDPHHNNSAHYNHRYVVQDPLEYKRADGTFGVKPANEYYKTVNPQ